MPIMMMVMMIRWFYQQRKQVEGKTFVGKNSSIFSNDEGEEEEHVFYLLAGWHNLMLVLISKFS